MATRYTMVHDELDAQGKKQTREVDEAGLAHLGTGWKDKKSGKTPAELLSVEPPVVPDENTGKGDEKEQPSE